MPPIYITKNGQQHGPYSVEQLDQLLQSETFNGDDLYWHEGANGWRPISQLPGYVPPPSTAPPPTEKVPIALPKASSSDKPVPSFAQTAIDADRLKGDHVKRIRSSSTYPTFRSLVGIFVFLIYIFAAICILGGLVSFVVTIAKDHLDEMGPGISIGFGGIMAGLIYIVMGKVLKETALMLADIADTLLDHHSRYDYSKQSEIRR